MAEVLLQNLMKQLECLMSDLKQPHNLAGCIQHMKSLPVEKYPLDEWDEALSYLSNSRIKFQNYHEVEAYLRQK